MAKKKEAPVTPEPAVARAWVGLWRDGSLGWTMPTSLYGKRASFTNHKFMDDDQDLYLCKVTIEPVLDKRGRPIKRTAGGLRSLTGYR